MDIEQINTLGALRASGYQPKSIKDELRANLVDGLAGDKAMFQGILGYGESVLPDLERALLSRHNIILLGLRGQAKTRIARQMTDLLDEYIPVVRGSELNDDPLNPLSRFAMDLIAEQGDDTAVDWLHRSDRYAEKLATPDVSVADLIGDMDPIKAANMRLSYSDERVIHFGLIPRSNRSIFVINELPDLQARIQVALFNILQEGDIQIRGFKLRLPLDMQFVFTANPEDYTNRGSIVTPLKDRIESQILTHYPNTLDISRAITQQEAKLSEEQAKTVVVPELARNLVEQIAIAARDSEFVDPKSGVSARLTITAFENLVSTAERRRLIRKETRTCLRVSDLWGVVPSITGKIELVYEGEQEGPYLVAQNLIGKAIRAEFDRLFPNPELSRKRKNAQNPYQSVIDWFGEGNHIDLINDMADRQYRRALDAVPSLKDIVLSHWTTPPTEEELYMVMEFVLHGLAEYSQLSRQLIDSGFAFKDLFSSVFTMREEEDADSE